MSSSSQRSSHFDARFWLITLSALLMCGLTASLGAWQLDRAAQKEKLREARANAQPIRLSGQWSLADTIYVDNRQMNAKQGFFVVTPLVSSSGDYVLVERGWIPRDFTDRKKLQAIETPVGTVTIAVRRIKTPAPPAGFAKDLNVEYPIVQFVDLAVIAKNMQAKTYTGMVQQVGETSEGLKRDWYEPASGAEKNYGYAFQWFALCALLAGLYVWFQWIKKE